MPAVPAVSVDLARWGPDRAYAAISEADAQTYSRQLAQTHYENFPVVTWLLPRKLHQHFYNVYAFCRWADDLGDEIGDPAESLRLLGWWRDELSACYRGAPKHPVFVALQPTIERFSIPAQPFADLISAFEQDQRVTEYETFDQLRDYCRRSADPVGRIVLHLCDSFTEQAAVWSDSVCTGLQLANMWQDVSRDLDIGRIYLPREDRERCGYTDGDLRSRMTNRPFLNLMRYQVDRARELLIAGLPVVDAVPGRLKIDIELFAQGGLAILREIERIGYRVWDQRPRLTKRHFAGLLTRAVWRRVTSPFRKLG